MKRLLVRRPGLKAGLELVEEPDPPAGPGQVRVRVKAAGVNYADWIVRLGLYEAAKGLYPLTPGFEFAGVVEALGPEVEGLREGQSVLGITRFGGYADCICVDARQVWPCPEGWDLAECAGLPAVFMTAHYGLFNAARVAPGETILVHSAAGGVGTALLQLAKLAGCPAVAVVGSAHKAALCRELGAYGVIVRSEQDLWAEAQRLAPGGYDAIFDANGTSTLKPGFEQLSLGGRLVVYGFAEIFPRGGRPNWAGLALGRLRVPSFSPLDLTYKNRAVAGFNVIHLFHRAELAQAGMRRILDWIAEGRIRKGPVTLVPFAQAEEAHRLLTSGTTVGKLVLTL